MRTVGLLMRMFSLAFHFFLGLVMVAIAGIASLGGQHNLQIGFLPWKGEALTWWLLGLGVAAIVFTVLGLKRIVPYLFILWSLAVVVLLVRGYFFSSYTFSPGGLSTALLFVGASILALAGSAVQTRGRRVARRNSVFA